MDAQQWIRFWSKVEKTAKCWFWEAAKSQNGYGRFLLNGRLEQAHRIAWQVCRGSIPDGLQIDHLCRVRNCMNPAHMEVVTQKENCLRGIGPTAKNATKTHCKRGHELSGMNLYTFPSGGRMCRPCHIERRAWRARKHIGSLVVGLLVAAALLIPAAHAQTYSPLVEAKIQFFDANGNPLAGGKVCSFVTGTATPLATYTDATGGTPNANPVVLDSAGRANIWLISTSTYRITLQDSTGLSTKCNGVQIWSADGVVGTLGSLTNVFVKNPTADQDSTGNYRIGTGGSLAWKSGTAFYGTLIHANTANRTYTFPNATGTVPLLSFANTWTATQAFADALTPTINGTNLGVAGIPGLRWNLYAVYGNFSNDVTPATNATVDLGTSSFKWKSIYGNDSVTIGAPSIVHMDYTGSTGLLNISAANVAYGAKIKVDAGPGSGGCLWLRSDTSPSNDCGTTGAITMGNGRYFYGRQAGGSGTASIPLIGTNSGDDVVVGGTGNDTGFTSVGSGKTVVGGLIVSVVAALKLVVGTLTNNSTTPSVVALIVGQASNTSVTTITDFTGGVTGQIIYILFTNGNTTIQDGAGLQLAGGANFVGTADDMLVLLRVGSVWYEVSRSVN